MKDLENRVAVITGAAGGIGRAVALRLAARGCHLALVDLDGPGLKATRALIPQGSGRISLHVADVSHRGTMAALPEEVLQVHGAVHILLNGAGLTLNQSFADHSPDDLELIFGVNLYGVLWSCRFFLPALKAADRALIVNVSSLAGFIGIPTQSTYAATKGAVKNLSEALRAELAPWNIGVTCLHPGAIRTNILHTAARRSADPAATSRLADLVDRFAMPVDRAAARIVRAIETEPGRRLIGLDARLVDVISRFFPFILSYTFRWGFRRTLG